MRLDGWWGRKGRARPVHLIGHIADAPQYVTEAGATYMVFHIREEEGTELRLKVLPTTPKRRQGDCVEITFVRQDAGRAVVESLTAVMDTLTTRRRNEEYLKQIEASQGGEKN